MEALERDCGEGGEPDAQVSRMSLEAGGGRGFGGVLRPGQTVVDGFLNFAHDIHVFHLPAMRLLQERVDGDTSVERSKLLLLGDLHGLHVASFNGERFQ